MAKDFGPWVRMDWCPTCCVSTEQSRWHSFVAPGSSLNGLKVRCNVCFQSVPTGYEELIMKAADPIAVLASAMPGRHTL
jgi:hypothetical protein